MNTGKTLTQKRFLTLTPPGEGDNQADFDRLLVALRPEFGNVRADARVMLRDLPILRQAEYRVTVTLADEGGDWNLLRVQAGDRASRHYGLACDLGSTTLAVQLIDLNSGGIVDTRTAVNPQVCRGADILSRIFYTREPGHEQERRKELQALTAKGIDDLIDDLARAHHVDLEDCPMLTIAGNTTMIHFLLAVDAFCVFAAPFAPAFNRVPMLDAPSLGMRYPGRVFCFPSAANYLGGDILSGLWATDIMGSDRLTLFMDIGTNGEMALGCRDFLIAGAGAAGPALEGGISRDGMRAAPGAVDSVRIQQGALSVTTIQGASPEGICGSGIVDLLAQMRLAGWMNSLGRLDPAASEHIRVVFDDHGREEPAVVYAQGRDGRPLMFTQSDVAQFANTKAAAHTMAACLLEAAGVEAERLDRVILAGAFGEHLNLESAITIGLYPDLPRDRFVSAGNASLAGARKLLLDRSGLSYLEKLLSSLYYLEFAMQPNFLDIMAAARFY